MNRHRIKLSAIGIAAAGLFVAGLGQGYAAKTDSSASSKAPAAKPAESRSSSAESGANKPGSPVSDRPQLTLALPASTKPGEAIKAEVSADAGLKNLAGAMVILHFQPGLFGPVAEDGDGVDSQIMKNPLVAEKLKDGKLNLGMVCRKGYNGPGLLATFPLTVSRQARPGRYPIRLDVELNDPAAKNMPAITRSATLVIGDARGAGGKGKRHDSHAPGKAD